MLSTNFFPCLLKSLIIMHFFSIEGHMRYNGMRTYLLHDIYSTDGKYLNTPPPCFADFNTAPYGGVFSLPFNEFYR